MSYKYKFHKGFKDYVACGPKHSSTYSMMADVSDTGSVVSHFLSHISSLSMSLSNLEILARYQCLLRNSFPSRLTPHFVFAQTRNYRVAQQKPHIFKKCITPAHDNVRRRLVYQNVRSLLGARLIL